MGRRKGPWLSWVKKGDVEQCKWLLEQFEQVANEQRAMKGKGDLSLSNWLLEQRVQIATAQQSLKDKEDLYGAIRAVVGLWPDPNDDSVETKKISELCLMLQKRWGSHRKRTQHPANRNYTFFMKKSLAPKIRAIASLWNMNEEKAIEMLITANADYQKATENLIREKTRLESSQLIGKLNNTISELNRKLASAQKSSTVLPQLPKRTQMLRNDLRRKTDELEKLTSASRHWLMELHTLKILMRDMRFTDIPTPVQVAEAQEACAKTLQVILEENKVEAARETVIPDADNQSPASLNVVADPDQSEAEESFRALNPIDSGNEGFSFPPRMLSNRRVGEDDQSSDLFELKSISSQMLQIRHAIGQGDVREYVEFNKLAERYCFLKYEELRTRLIRAAQLCSWAFNVPVELYTLGDDKYPSFNVETLDCDIEQQEDLRAQDCEQVSELPSVVDGAPTGELSSRISDQVDNSSVESSAPCVEPSDILAVDTDSESSKDQ